MHHRRLLVVFLLLVIATFCFVQCFREPAYADPRGSSYAGIASCVQCHGDIVNSYSHTSHFNASAPVVDDSIRKTFRNNPITVNYTNGQKVVLEEIDGNAMQSLYAGDKRLLSEKMDIAFGSGEKAQTFAYWKDDQVFQLPLTYLTYLNLWTNSPGFPVDHPYYTRPVISKCFECHSSYAFHYNRATGSMKIKETFSPASIVYGIDCERCHGPAKQHVDFLLKNPAEKKAKHLTAIQLLNRTQQSDLCGTCHSGNAASLKSIFAFTPGDSLKDYLLYYPGSLNNPDVHGMQMQSLQQSACYKQSTLTCLTCHNPHQVKKQTWETLTAACTSCHHQSPHSSQMIQEKKNCISCHMPLQSSKSLDFKNSTGRKSIPYTLRTHRIAVYPESAWQ